MITVVNGDTDTFRALAYGRPDMTTINWCREREQQQLAVVDPFIRNNYIQQQGTVFGDFDIQGIANVARAVSHYVEEAWYVDNIRTLNTLEELQLPPVTMVKWIMACPEVRTRYHEQSLAGYDDLYVDLEPGKNGEDHYYYRRVVDGVFLEDKDTGDWTANEWVEELHEEEDLLDFTDQTMILATWRTMVRELDKNTYDPTSQFNAML